MSVEIQLNQSDRSFKTECLDYGEIIPQSNGKWEMENGHYFIGHWGKAFYSFSLSPSSKPMPDAPCPMK